MREEERRRQIAGLGPYEPLPKAEVKKPDREPSLSWLRRDASEEDQYFKKRYGLTLKETVQKIAMSKRLDAGGPIKVRPIYEIKNERTLKDLLALSGGLGDIAFKGRVQVLRVKDRREMVLFEDDLTKVMGFPTRPSHLPQIVRAGPRILPFSRLCLRQPARAHRR